MSARVHLVDGTYELFRAHFGAPPATGADGREIGATRGLARSMLALVRRDGATHVGIAFDHVVESFRNELFAGYKTGEGIDRVILEQFELAERLCSALGFVVWPMVEFEADDALASAAALYGNDGVQVLICSPDKDLAQCVSGSRIVCLDRRRERTLDEEGVRRRFGVIPSSIPDWLALVGDAADGIPGIPRWGAKSASAVLAEYESIDAIPEDPSDWRVRPRGASALARNLNAMRDDALLYRRLATLRRDVPIGESPEELEWTGASRDLLQPLAAELGDERLVESVPRWRDR